MPLMDITDDSFREIYKEHDIVVLDFWAVWCGPCRQFAPTFEAVSEELPDIVFGKVETETEQKLSAYFGVRSIPTILIIREELEVFRHSGTLGRDELLKIITQVRDADMDEVRAELDPDGEAE